MSRKKKEKIIKVKNLTVIADNVKFIRDRDRDDHDDRRDPWDIFWGRSWDDEDEEDIEE